MDIPIIYRRNYNNNNYIIVLLRLFISLYYYVHQTTYHMDLLQTPTNGGDAANINVDISKNIGLQSLL